VTADTPARIIVRDLVKVFYDAAKGAQILALDHVSLAVRDREFVALLGPSGCGKSTLLNLVAGFEQPTSGDLLLDGRQVSQPGPDRGVVFQEFALFPWMTVSRNIEFGLQNRGIPRARREETVRRFIELIGLNGFEDRYPRELSGGMKQRVAIARVLANDPAILLMDEPFAALDALTRQAMQAQLLEAWATVRNTVLFVTHSIDEALFLSDRVAVMTARPGRIVEIIDVNLPRPRDLTSEAFNDLRRRASAVLEVALRGWSPTGNGHE
jgi:NitT/TauT family transport system ATP-binding protein